MLQAIGSKTFGPRAWVGKVNISFKQQVRKSSEAVNLTCT